MATDTIGKDFLTDSQRAGVEKAQATVNSSTLVSDGDDPILPNAQPPTDRTGVIDSSLQGLMDRFAADAPQEDTQDDLRSQLLESIDTLGGQKQRQQELEQEAGLDIQRKELQGVINELQTLQKEAAAIPLSIQEEFAGRGATKGGVEPIQAGRLRQNAIKALSQAAIGQTLQGNLSLAEQTIARAIEAEFEPERQKLQILQQLYTFNREDLERVDKKRADRLQISLQERERLLNAQEADKQSVYNLAVQASTNEAPQSIVNKALRAKSSYEALSILSPYMVNPEQARQRLFNEKVQLAQLSLGEANFEENKRQFDLKFAQTEQVRLEQLRADALAASAVGEISSYAQERITRNLNSITDLRTLTSDKTVGFGSLLQKVPTSQALTFKKKLDTLKANIAFGEITAMREASKTGGALGQVSERELALLEAALGGIDQAMSVEDFQSALDEIEGSIKRWRDAAVNKQSTTGTTEFTSSSGQVYTLPNQTQ